MKKLISILLLFLSTVLFSCAGMQKGTERSQLKAEEKLSFLFTNFTMGMLEPDGCGCRQQGGLAKRAGLINELRKTEENILVFDTGNILANQSTIPDREKTVYILIALNKMEIDALNVGAYDAVRSRFLKQKETRLVFPLLSANIRSTLTGDLIFKPFTIKQTQGIKIGIFGLTSDHADPGILKNKDIFIDEPVTEALKTVSQLKSEGCDLIILLSQLKDKENIKVAKQVPGIHFIFGSSSKKTQKSTKTVEDTMIFSPGIEGKKATLVQTSVRVPLNAFYDIRAKRAVESRIKVLKEKKPGDPAQLEKIALEKDLMEERLKSFSHKSECTFKTIVLNKNIENDNRIKLLIEKYKQSRLRKTLPDYHNNIPTVDLSGMTEEKKLLALRLINEIKCYEDINIASSAGNDPFCSNLANLIINLINKGESEGKIRYSIIQEKTKNKKSLDKNFQFQ